MANSSLVVVVVMIARSLGSPQSCFRSAHLLCATARSFFSPARCSVCGKLPAMKSVLPPMLLVAMAACGAAVLAANPGADPPAQKPAAEAKKEGRALVGPARPDQIEGGYPEWVHAEVESQPDAETAKALASVPPGAEVTVFLGTWCGDSRREVPRLWKALDTEGGAVPFQIRYIGVDHDKKQPADLIKEDDVRYLPTFIVRRGGHEVGRIVESSPHGVEQDLLALLTGKASGVLTTRQDLTPANPHPQG